MGRLIEEGKIKGWGLSAVNVDIIKQVHAITPLTAVQNIYNILERDCEDEVIPFCLENNIGIVPFSPIASGFLSGRISEKTVFEKVDDVRNFVPQLSKENMKANQPILNILQQYAKEKNATLAQISLSWMLKKYPDIVPIPGSKNKDRIIENLQADQVELSDKEFECLQKALDETKVYGHRGIYETQHLSFRDKWDKGE